MGRTLGLWHVGKHGASPDRAWPRYSPRSHTRGGPAKKELRGGCTGKNGVWHMGRMGCGIWEEWGVAYGKNWCE